MKKQEEVKAFSYKITDVVTQTENRFVNLYKILYELNGTPRVYEGASRNKKDKLGVWGGEQKVNAASVMGIYKHEGIDHIVFIKNYRILTGGYVVEFPAGLVEEGDTERETMRKEYKQETGGILGKIKMFQPGYNSAGLTDELSQFAIAEVLRFEEPEKEETEDIEVCLVPVEDAEKFIEGKRISARVAAVVPLYVELYNLRKEMQKNV